MIPTRWILVVSVLVPSLASAEVDPVAIRVPETTAWTGQRVSFFVDLRAAGSFDGSASFSLPEVPRSLIIKVGNPVVSSKEIEGESWFVQTHEFAMFSQQSGTVKIPPFEVRFAGRDGFTGPVNDQQATVPGASVQIRRPPNSDQLGFLVTTESIDVDETWEPQPGPAKVGDVFKRTITQTADQMTGIALAPPPQATPDGVRLYVGEPHVADDTERGNLIGRREDALTYVLQEPGSHTLPGITYVWWNPQTKELGSKTLPAVTFEVAAPPASADPQTSSTPHRAWIWWLTGAALVGGVCVWQRQQRLADALGACWRRLNPPDRVAARRLLRACRRNDSAAASQSWRTWRDLQVPTFMPAPKLQSAVVDLERHLYGSGPIGDWQGRQMESVFREQLIEMKGRRRRDAASDLPRLNPSS